MHVSKSLREMESQQEIQQQIQQEEDVDQQHAAEDQNAGNKEDEEVYAELKVLAYKVC